jgi:hypothetical protein
VIYCSRNAALVALDRCCEAAVVDHCGQAVDDGVRSACVVHGEQSLEIPEPAACAPLARPVPPAHFDTSRAAHVDPVVGRTEDAIAFVRETPILEHVVDLLDGFFRCCTHAASVFCTHHVQVYVCVGHVLCLVFSN